MRGGLKREQEGSGDPQAKPEAPQGRQGRAPAQAPVAGQVQGSEGDGGQAFEPHRQRQRREDSADEAGAQAAADHAEGQTQDRQDLHVVMIDAAGLELDADPEGLGRRKHRQDRRRGCRSWRPMPR